MSSVGSFVPNLSDMGSWWRSILENDEAMLERTRREEKVVSPFMLCVFCGRWLDPSTPSNLGATWQDSATLSWWTNASQAVVACGLVCRNRCCMMRAEKLGGLKDVAAYKTIGPNALLEMRRIFYDYKSWTGDASVRMVRLMGEMTSLVAYPSSLYKEPKRYNRKRFSHLNDIPNCGGVYFVQTGSEDGPTKIGKAEKIQNRMRALQISSPYQLRLIRFERIEKDSDRSLREKELHKQFSHLRIVGEWFAFDPIFKEGPPLFKEGR